MAHFTLYEREKEVGKPMVSLLLRSLLLQCDIFCVLVWFILAIWSHFWRTHIVNLPLFPPPVAALIPEQSCDWLNDTEVTAIFYIFRLFIYFGMFHYLGHQSKLNGNTGRIGWRSTQDSRLVHTLWAVSRCTLGLWCSDMVSRLCIRNHILYCFIVHNLNLTLHFQMAHLHAESFLRA